MSNRLWEAHAPAIHIPERTIRRMTDAEFWDFMAQMSPEKATFPFPFYRGPSGPLFITATGGTITTPANRTSAGRLMR